MLEIMLEQFRSFYVVPGLSFIMVLQAIALALIFGAIWLIIYRPWRFNKAWWVVIMIVGAILTWTAIAFIQVPLQIWTHDGMLRLMGRDNLMHWLYLTGIPIVLISGLVQEGAKLVPVIALWFSRGKQLDPQTGLYAGAISGAGFGIFEAFWIHNMIFAYGWTWQIVSINGPAALLGFVERFFTIGTHIAISALAGYGWAKGLKWQYYLIAAGLHGLTNYSMVLNNRTNLTHSQIEIYIGALALAVTVYAFLVLRSCKRPAADTPDKEMVAAADTPE